jgi:hypothetical protein
LPLYIQFIESPFDCWAGGEMGALAPGVFAGAPLSADGVWACWELVCGILPETGIIKAD